MNGKGSRRRPTSKESQSSFDAQWDLIFGGKNMKKQTMESPHLEHKRRVEICERVSTHWSTNGKKEAIVVRTDDRYSVELFEQSRYIRTVDCSEHNINWAEDVAENYVLGILS